MGSFKPTGDHRHPHQRRSSSWSSDGMLLTRRQSILVHVSLAHSACTCGPRCKTARYERCGRHQYQSRRPVHLSRSGCGIAGCGRRRVYHHWLHRPGQRFALYRRYFSCQSSSAVRAVMIGTIVSSLWHRPGANRSPQFFLEGTMGKVATHHGHRRDRSHAAAARSFSEQGSGSLRV